MLEDIMSRINTSMDVFKKTLHCEANHVFLEDEDFEALASQLVVDEEDQDEPINECDVIGDGIFWDLQCFKKSSEKDVLEQYGPTSRLFRFEHDNIILYELY